MSQSIKFNGNELLSFPIRNFSISCSQNYTYLNTDVKDACFIAVMDDTFTEENKNFILSKEIEFLEIYEDGSLILTSSKWKVPENARIDFTYEVLSEDSAASYTLFLNYQNIENME